MCRFPRRRWASWCCTGCAPGRAEMLLRRSSAKPCSPGCSPAWLITKARARQRVCVRMLASENARAGLGFLAAMAVGWLCTCTLLFLARLPSPRPPQTEKPFWTKRHPQIKATTTLTLPPFLSFPPLHPTPLVRNKSSPFPPIPAIRLRMNPVVRRDSGVPAVRDAPVQEAVTWIYPPPCVCVGGGGISSPRGFLTSDLGIPKFRGCPGLRPRAWIYLLVSVGAFL